MRRQRPTRRRRSSPPRRTCACSRRVRCPIRALPGVTVRSLAGGLLVQSRDNGVIAATDLKVVSKRPPSERELADLLFAFKVAKHVKSNAIVYAKDGATVGIGAGQMSRVDSVRIAALKAADAARELGIERTPDARLRRRFGRLLSVCRRAACGRRGRRHRRHSAGRIDARRGSDRRCRRQGPCHGLHRHAPLPALSMADHDAVRLRPAPRPTGS